MCEALEITKEVSKLLFGLGMLVFFGYVFHRLFDYLKASE